MSKRFSEIASRLTGISCAIFGVSWQPPTSDVAVARGVIVFLEDRRVLYELTEVEVADHCVSLVLEIRRFLTSTLADGGLAPDLSENLGAMRAACRDFLGQIGAASDRDDPWPPPGRLSGHRSGLDDWMLNQALGRLRGVFGGASR